MVQSVLLELIVVLITLGKRETASSFNLFPEMPHIAS